LTVRLQLQEQRLAVLSNQRNDVSARLAVEHDCAPKPSASSKASRRNRSMFQTLLVDRFKLAVHHESKQVGAYELVVVKSGLKLQESTGPRTFFTARPALISGTRVSMRELAAARSRLLDRPTTDRTDLAGVYDVKVQRTPDSVNGDLGTSVFTALQEQLGLKLESTKAAVDVIVVDHVERPTPD
jgi:uncharacterized protein (TIGR03435 family)